MLEQAKRILFRISSVLSKVEPEPGAGPSHWLQLRPKSTGSGSATLLAGVSDPGGFRFTPRGRIFRDSDFRILNSNNSANS